MSRRRPLVEKAVKKEAACPSPGKGDGRNGLEWLEEASGVQERDAGPQAGGKEGGTVHQLRSQQERAHLKENNSGGVSVGASRESSLTDCSQPSGPEGTRGRCGSQKLEGQSGMERATLTAVVVLGRETQPGRG